MREGKGGRRQAAPRSPVSPPLRPPPYHLSRCLPPFPVPGYRKASSPAAGLPPGQCRSWLHRQRQPYQEEGRRRRPCSGAAGGHVPRPRRLSCFVAVYGRSCACWYVWCRCGLLLLLLLEACCYFLCLDAEDFMCSRLCVWHAFVICVVSRCAGPEGGRGGDIQPLGSWDGGLPSLGLFRPSSTWHLHCHRSQDDTGGQKYSTVPSHISRRNSVLPTPLWISVGTSRFATIVPVCCGI